MKELSLFTGAGGGLLGSKILGWRSIGYVEYEKYCQEIIKQRIADGILDPAPIFGDIRRFISEGYVESYKGMVDIITGGFPCQPFSVAGKRTGENDPRNMWPQTLECICLVRPKYVFLENVPGLLGLGYFGTILGGLAKTGYDARWCVLGADDVGAWHERKRLWIFAYPKQSSHYSDVEFSGIQIKWGENKKVRGSYWEQFELVNSPVAPSKWRKKGEEFTAKPLFLRMGDGMGRELDRLKAIGNGQVPLCMAYAFSVLSEGIVE